MSFINIFARKMVKKTMISAVFIALLAPVLGVLSVPVAAHILDTAKPASPSTAAINRAVIDRLPLSDPTDLKNAQKGLIAELSEDIFAPNGRRILDLDSYDFMGDIAPANAPVSVNPSLWRHGQNARVSGLFKVRDGIYQLRGYDIAVMTFIKGDTGWIVIDPLMVKETAVAGLKLFREHVSEDKIKAVIYTHSHQDHFSGVMAVLDEAGDGADDIRIIAPDGFSKETIAEHILAGNHMNRRIWYQGGAGLPNDPLHRMGIGLSQNVGFGTMDLVLPTYEIKSGGETLELDGVTFVFLDANETEATAELVFYLPDYELLHSSEVVTEVQHNVLTPRGAVVRDTLRWSETIDEMLAKFGEADIMTASHHWPVWGSDAVREKLRNQRNLYRYLHDQTLRLANHGMTMHEISDAIQEPQLMQRDFATRPYYGDFRQNSRAVYQRYFGWWDGVPANLHPHAPEVESAKYVAALGGTDKTLALGLAANAQGDYRFSAKLLNHLVFAEPDNNDGRKALADAYEQLGFQQESGIFRAYYLQAAQDLRRSREDKRILPKNGGVKAHDTLPTGFYGNWLASRFNPSKFAALKTDRIVLEINLQDRGQILSLDMDADVLFPRLGKMRGTDVRIKTSMKMLDDFLSGKVAVEDVTRRRKNQNALLILRDSLDNFVPGFNVVEP